jgi:hypothetical protein
MNTIKVILIITQPVGAPHNGVKLEELKEELEKKSGMDVILLLPGMTVECLTLQAQKAGE